MGKATLSEISELARNADEKQLEALERNLSGDARKGVVRALASARARIEAEKAESSRLLGMYEFQRSLAEEHGRNVVVGVDEVGRGPLAGPLAVGAVVLPDSPVVPGLNDSKQVKPESREKIAEAVKDAAVAWSVTYVEPAEIDRIGIMASLKAAFSEAVLNIESAGCEVDMVLLDGNPLHFDSREVNVVKGDAKCASIAAASILAKVERDSLMDRLDTEYPGYGFSTNKGYGTQEHRDAIHRLGLSDIHRKSYCGEFLQVTLF